jgi:hypothetical protein
MNRTDTHTLPGITLDKTPGRGTGTEQGNPTPRMVRRPWYPLMGHRAGLRANDLNTLGSALWLLALEGGTAHLSCSAQVQLNGVAREPGEETGTGRY